MIRLESFRLALCLVLLLTSLPFPVLASGEGVELDVSAANIEVVESSSDYLFGEEISFTLRATSGAEIDSVYLFLRAGAAREARSIELAIEPSTQVELRYVRDLRQFPLPPFSTVEYWWEVTDSLGERFVTEPQQFEYLDNRLPWEERSEGPITVHWTEGDGAFGQTALDVTSASLAEVNRELRAPLPTSIDVYLYGSYANLSEAMDRAGRDWVQGEAHPELGAIVVAIPPGDGYTSRMKRLIPHELTHLLVYEAVSPEGYPYVPEWLDEGLATANERVPLPEYQVTLEEALAEGRLIPLRELCHPFSPDQNGNLLSYAQSASVVSYLREDYGASTIRDLLAAYADGAGCEGGVRQVLGKGLDGLGVAWQASLEPEAPWHAVADRLGVWVALWVLSLAVAVPMLGSLRQLSRR